MNIKYTQVLKRFFYLLMLFPILSFANISTTENFGTADLKQYLAGLKNCTEGVYKVIIPQFASQKVYLIKDAGDRCDVYSATTNGLKQHAVFLVPYPKQDLKNISADNSQRPFTLDKAFSILGAVTGLGPVTLTQVCQDNTKNFYEILSKGNVPDCQFTPLLPRKPQ